MRRVLLIVLSSAIAISLAGCCTITRFHTQEVDRVDQDVSKGNRGYLKGEPPAAPDRGTPKRQFMAMDVDIEMPYREAEGSETPVSVQKAPPEEAQAPVPGAAPAAAKREAKAAEEDLK